MGVYLMQKELAELVGKTDRMIRMIDRDRPEDSKLCVKAEGGKYDAAVFVQRWVDMMVDKATADMQDLDAVKARHEIVKTEKTELEVAKMRGDLVSVQDVKRLWGDISSTIMQGMLRLPSTLAPMLQGIESIETLTMLIDGEIRNVLNGLADTPLPEYAVKQEDGSGEE